MSQQRKKFIEMCVEMSNFLNFIEVLRSVINNEGKRPLGRPRHRREDNIKMALQEVGCGFLDRHL